LASRKIRATTVLDFLLQFAPIRQRRVWKAEKDLSGASSPSTVGDIEILGTDCVTEQIRNGAATAARELFEGRELERIHEDLYTLGLCHPCSMRMHMCMSNEPAIPSALAALLTSSSIAARIARSVSFSKCACSSCVAPEGWWGFSRAEARPPHRPSPR
jgi:hypothetical protein